MICYHHNDLDGKCAAAIVLKAHPKCKMREIDYKDDPDFEKEVETNEKVFIVDFSFKPEKMFELLAQTESKNIFWIDHHETAEGYRYHDPFEGREVSLKGLRDFSTECKKSGCELTWEYLFSEPLPEAVRLLGDYDTWRFDTPGETNLFQQGMRLKPNYPSATTWERLLNGGEGAKIAIKARIAEGAIATQYRDEFCHSYSKSYGWEVDFEGHKCYAMNLYMVGSQGFGDRLHKYDILLSFVYQSGRWTVSLYSKDIHVGEIAKKYGGGGHKGAAGFVCKDLPF